MRDQITSEFLKSLAAPAAAPAGVTVAALALAEAAALLARTGAVPASAWMPGLRLAEQDVLAARSSDAAAACGPPADVIAAAEELLASAERWIADGPGRDVQERALLDIAAAAEAVRFAVVTAQVAIELRFERVPGDERAGLPAAVAAADGLAARAAAITAAVRARAGAVVA